MRKITWLILLFILITWLSISAYWTGTGSSQKIPQENQITSTPAPEPSVTTPELPISPSATPSSIPTVTPSAGSKLKF